MNLSNDIYTAFMKYEQVGMDPLPIPYEDGHPTKGPKVEDWPTRAANHEFTEADFEDPCNIGVLLGGNKNLTDIDLDSPEAVCIGVEVLDDLMTKTGTTVMFGRPSKPRSHYVFYSDRSLPVTADLK